MSDAESCRRIGSVRLRLALLLLPILAACSRSPVDSRPRGGASASAAQKSSRPLDGGRRRALGLGFTGFATLGFDASRLARDHTLSVRFMPVYEGAYRGVVVSDASGSYRVGMAPYASLGQPAVEVSLAGSTLTSPLPAPVLSNHDFQHGAPRQPTPRWLQLVVSVRASRAQVFLNGEPIGALALEAHDFSGPLLLGRLARALDVQDQFYGFIDDVAVFERPLDAPEVRALWRLPRIDPKLAGLLALADFDQGSTGGLRLSPTLQGAAQLVPLGNERDAGADSSRFPRPLAVSGLTLPFPRGQVWMLIQGMNSARSHHDTAAFALDFQRVDPALTHPGLRDARLPGSSAGQPILAAAAGTVVSRVDCFADDNRGLCPGMKPRPGGDPEHGNRNLICVEHAKGVVSCYLHLKAHSARVRVGDTVPAGALLGLVGQSGTSQAHLHFALSDRAEPNEPGTFADLTTLPFEFEDYEASNDLGRSFARVESGTPRPGQWLRRP